MSFISDLDSLTKDWDIVVRGLESKMHNNALYFGLGFTLEDQSIIKCAQWR